MARGDTVIESIRLPGFVGGLNTEADEFQLEADESPDCLNVDFGIRGAVSKRKGYSLYSTASTWGVLKLAHWKKAGGNDYMLAPTITGTIRHANVSSTVTFTDMAAGWGAPASMEEWWTGVAGLDDFVYCSRVDGNVWKFDGTTWTEMTDYTLSGGGTEFPRAAHLLSMHERIFAANVNNGGTRYRSRIYFSDAGAAETWQTASWIDVSPDDGQQITALIAYGESILVFKESSVFVLSGVDPTSFTLYPLDAEVGTIAPQSAHANRSTLIFFDPRKGVFEFDGADFKKIDEKVMLHILDGINYSLAYKAAGYVYRDKYYLSVPWGAATDNNRTFVYDTRTKAWTQYSYGVNGMEFYIGDLYGGEASGVGGIYKMLDGVADVAATISAHVETSWLAPENEAVRGRLRRVDFAFTAIGNFNVTAKLYRDFASDAYKTQTINTDPGGSLWGTVVWGGLWGGAGDQVYKRTVGWGGRWRVIKFRLEEATATGQFQLNRMNLHHSSLDRVRGTP